MQYAVCEAFPEKDFVWMEAYTVCCDKTGLSFLELMVPPDVEAAHSIGTNAIREESCWTEC